MCCGQSRSWRSCSPSDRVEPAETDGIAFAAEQRHDFVERQADDVGVGTDDLDDESPGNALRGIAAGLAAPLAGGKVRLDVFFREALEAHARLHEPLTECFLRRDQADGRVDTMIASGEKAQALRRLVEQFRLGK